MGPIQGHPAGIGAQPGAVLFGKALQDGGGRPQPGLGSPHVGVVEPAGHTDRDLPYPFAADAETLAELS